MTVSSEICAHAFAFTGVETVFSAGFPADDPLHVHVDAVDHNGVRTPLTYNVDYSIALTPLVVVMRIGAFPLSTVSLSIERRTPMLQPVVFADGVDFPADVHRRLHDQHVMRDQEIRASISDALAVVDGIAAVVPTALSAAELSQTYASQARADKLALESALLTLGALTAAGDGIADDRAAIQTFWNDNKAVRLLSGKTYAIGATLNGVAGGVMDAWGATIKARAGFSGDYMLAGADDLVVLGATFDAAGNLANPTIDWAGSGWPKGSGLYSAGKKRMVFICCTFKNMPSAAAFLRENQDCLFLRCVAKDCQGYTTVIPCSVFETYGGSSASEAGGRDIVFDGCVVDGYARKAFNCGNEMRPSTLNCIARGGPQNFGHAAFYEDGCVDALWLAPRHIGTGHAFKAVNFKRSRLIEPQFDGSRVAMLWQNGEHGRSNGGYWNPPTAAYPNHGEYAIGFDASAGAGLIDVRVSGFKAKRATPGVVGLNQYGVSWTSSGGKPFRGVSVEDCDLDGFYIGAMGSGVTGPAEGIVVRRNRFPNCTDYPLLLLADSGVVDDNYLATTAADKPGGYIASPPAGEPGGVMRVRNNALDGMAAHWAFEIGFGFGPGVAKWAELDASGNRASGGAGVLKINVNAPGNYIYLLRMHGNVHAGGAVGSAAISVALNAAIGVIWSSSDNVLLNSAGARNPMEITGSGAIGAGSHSCGDIVSSIVGAPPALTIV